MTVESWEMSIPFSIINYYGYSVNFLKRMDLGEKSWLLEVVDNSNEKVVLVEETKGSEIEALASILKSIDFSFLKDKK
jgi:hypothetical protein